MSRDARVTGWGFLISALGSLPLGVLNITAMQISLHAGLYPAILFSLGVALVEICYVRLCLYGLQWIRSHQGLLRVMDWLSVIIVLGLGVAAVFAGLHPSGKTVLPAPGSLSFFPLGVLMSALNPVQIPFWLGWSSFLFSRNILRPTAASFNAYIFGIGIGTIFGLAVFVWGGPYVVALFNASASLIQFAIAAIFFATATIQLVKLLRKKGLAEQTETKAAVYDDNLLS